MSETMTSINIKGALQGGKNVSSSTLKIRPYENMSIKFYPVVHLPLFTKRHPAGIELVRCPAAAG